MHPVAWVLIRVTEPIHKGRLRRMASKCTVIMARGGSFSYPIFPQHACLNSSGQVPSLGEFHIPTSKWERDSGGGNVGLGIISKAQGYRESVDRTLSLADILFTFIAIIVD